jgi:CheY-like chemotaxis protein
MVGLGEQWRWERQTALPAEERLKPASAVNADRDAKSDAGRQSRELKILIADDRESFRHAVSSILAELPELELVAEAADGAEAVKKAAELNPDLILLDMSLPEINGVEAAARMRRVAPNAKILFLTRMILLISAALRVELGYVLKADVRNERCLMAVLRQTVPQFRPGYPAFSVNLPTAL